MKYLQDWNSFVNENHKSGFKDRIAKKREEIQSKIEKLEKGTESDESVSDEVSVADEVVVPEAVAA